MQINEPFMQKHNVCLRCKEVLQSDLHALSKLTECDFCEKHLYMENH